MVGGSAGLSTSSTSLVYAWLEGGNKGQDNLHISTHRLPHGNANYLSSTLDTTFNCSGRQAARDQC